MKVKHYELTLQLLSREQSDDGFLVESHTVARLQKPDLELPFDQFAERYLRPMWEKTKAEHDWQFAHLEDVMQVKR